MGTLYWKVKVSIGKQVLGLLGLEEALGFKGLKHRDVVPTPNAITRLLLAKNADLEAQVSRGELGQPPVSQAQA